MKKIQVKQAVSAIEKNGALLVYPIDNRKFPASLWSVFYPKSPMRWEWDEDGDDRVSNLWHLRMELSSSSKVVYSKWYQGRATFFSKEVFKYLAVFLNSTQLETQKSLSQNAKEILEVLRLDSPLSTKQLKLATGLRGKQNESVYMRSLKELWEKLLIVGFGEVEDGAFPSLAVGATENLFEDLWNETRELKISENEAFKFLTQKLGNQSLFLKQLQRIKMKKTMVPLKKVKSHVAKPLEWSDTL